MSNKAKVTVIIPNYNGLKFMDPCFKALDLQLCRDFDILVVDNLQDHPDVGIVGPKIFLLTAIRYQASSLRRIPVFQGL